MSPSLLDYVCCPRCGGSLRLGPGTPPDPVEGELACSSCASSYPVRGGVPILLSKLSDAEELTAKNFGEQWKEFSGWKDISEWEEGEFAEYMKPLDCSALQGKTCLEGGCGYGRNLIAAKKHGAAAAIGFDVGAGAFIAKRKGVDAVIGDILNPPFRPGFDVVFTFGVLQHVSEPEEGLRKLYALCAPGGLFVHSVYAAENNFLLSHILTPVRERFLRYLPPAAKWALSWALGAPSYLIFSLLYRPFTLHPAADAWACEHLFYYEFLAMHFKRLGFKLWVAFIQDQINAPLAEYFPRARVEGWMEALGLLDRRVFFRNKNTWNFSGRKTAG